MCLIQIWIKQVRKGGGVSIRILLTQVLLITLWQRSVVRFPVPDGRLIKAVDDLTFISTDRRYNLVMHHRLNIHVGECLTLGYAIANPPFVKRTFHTMCFIQICWWLGLYWRTFTEVACFNRPKDLEKRRDLALGQTSTNRKLLLMINSVKTVLSDLLIWDIWDSRLSSPVSRGSVNDPPSRQTGIAPLHRFTGSQNSFGNTCGHFQ